MLERIFNFVEQYHPGIARTLRGATPDEAARLEDLAGHRLPASYLEFLLSMGSYSGAMLRRFSNFDFTCRAIQEFYAEADRPPPPEYLCIARNTGGGDQEWYLDLRPARPEPPVVVIDYYAWVPRPLPQTLPVLFEDLESLLVIGTFLSVRLPVLPHAAVFSSGRQPEAGDQELLDQLAGASGLTALPKTGTDTRCYNGPDLAIYAYQPAGSGMRLEFGARQPEVFTEVADQLRTRLSMIRVQ
ncbi:MAG: SMI1/KNR4 family protein [Candidatus Solibacter sp.]